MPAPRDRTPVLFLHGFWHGSWCWTEVLAGLTGAGVPVTVVAHSMGGTVLTRAGQLAPELIAHAVYLAAFMPASGVPSAAYPRMPENEGSRVGALRVGDARVTALTADGWGSISRTYVVCTGDATIPPALQRKFIADADAAFPGNRTAVRELEASHSPFLSMPDQVAGIVLDVLS
jgi:pimeloyl-ACP methyl ester carboxylesterase